MQTIHGRSVRLLKQDRDENQLPDGLEGKKTLRNISLGPAEKTEFLKSHLKDRAGSDLYWLDLVMQGSWLRVSAEGLI